jgi:hypothetical protein
MSQGGRLNLRENPFQRKPENPVRETAFLDGKIQVAGLYQRRQQDQPGKTQLLKL